MDKPRLYSLFAQKEGVKTVHLESDSEYWLNYQCKLLINRGFDVTCYIDTRYKAKLRLYRYWLRKTDIERFSREYPYSPYSNNPIGKTIPILNF